MPATKSKRAFSHVIADTREAKVLVQLVPDVLKGLCEALKAQGITMQQFALDDELVLTVARRRVSAADVARAVDTYAEVLEEL